MREESRSGRRPGKQRGSVTCNALPVLFSLRLLGEYSSAAGVSRLSFVPYSSVVCRPVFFCLPLVYCFSNSVRRLFAFRLPERGMVGKQVLAGLSDVQLKFINSAGPEERDRLLVQVWYCAKKIRCGRSDTMSLLVCFGCSSISEAHA